MLPPEWGLLLICSQALMTSCFTTGCTPALPLTPPLGQWFPEHVGKLGCRTGAPEGGADILLSVWDSSCFCL